MGLTTSTASSLMKAKHVILAIGLCLTAQLFSQEIMPGTLHAAVNTQALNLTSQEVAWLKQHPQLRVAVRNGWMPVEFQLENQKHKGVSIQYLEKISQLTGIALTVVDYHDNLTPQEASVITGVRGVPPQGYTLLDTPYLESLNAIYTSVNQVDHTGGLTLEDLSNQRVAVFRSGPMAQKLKTMVPGIKIKLVDIADEAFEYLAAGSIDAYVGNELVLDYHLDFHKIKTVKKSGITPITSKVYMAVSDTSPELRSIFNKATLHIGTNPPDILDTWRRNPDHSLTQYLAAALAFFAVLLLIQLAKLYRTNKQQAAAAQHEIWFQANHDFLTKLPNRFQLQQTLHEALNSSSAAQHALGVIIIDVDNFKEINDTAGHAVGDAVLIQVAERIQSVIRAPDVVSRFGGDEFLIVIKKAMHQEYLNQICTQLIQVMNPAMTVQQKTFNVSISIGAALFPDHSLQAEELVMFADHALYQAKRTGKNKCVLFNESMQELFTRKTLLNTELKHAIDRQQLRLQYQPIFNLSTMRCEKVEALLRWHHPEFGAIPPDVFIRIAEENNLIIELGEWVFSQVLTDAPTLLQRMGEIEICINISPLQFSHPATIHGFLSRIQATGISGRHFCMEITEGLLLEPSRQVIDTLNSIHEQGVKLAIDDFGTGYSSLAYLNKFKIDYVKIDKSFIKHISDNQNDQALCKTMIFMGNQLKIQLIAEGVETLAQEQILKDMGCQYTQGYFRGMPVNLEALNTTRTWLV